MGCESMMSHSLASLTEDINWRKLCASFVPTSREDCVCDDVYGGKGKRGWGGGGGRVMHVGVQN